ncbi:MAG: hypothetical protein ACRDS1_07325 [Pseudonocardiaceae bacterium]
MRILNRVIAAVALVVPMALGASGFAVADVAAGSTVPPAQSGVPDDDSVDECDDENGILGILGGGDRSYESECEEDGNNLLG